MSNDIPKIPNQKDYENLTPFDLVLIQKFPFIEEDFDAINLYGILNKIKDGLNTVIANEQAVTENQQNVFNSFVDLHNYVEDYFTNLDVQEEINNKLDEMAEDGTITRLIKNYIDPYISTQNNKINQIESVANSLASGSPAGTFATVNELETINPSHDRIYVVNADGKWYYWNSSNNSWTAGGVYQSTLIGNKSIKIENFDNKLLDALALTCESVVTNSTTGTTITNVAQYSSNENYSLTDVIELEPNKTIKFTTSVIYKTNALLAQTNSDGTSILKVLIQGEDSQDVKNYEYTNNSKNSIFVRICYRTSKALTNLFIYTSMKIQNKNLGEKCVNIENLNDELNNFIGIEYNPIEPNINNSTGIDMGKNITTNSNYSTTDVITLEPGKTIGFTATVVYPQMALLAQTNQAGDSVSSILIPGEDNANIKHYTYTNNTNNSLFVRICYRTNKGLTNVNISKKPISEEIVNQISSNIFNNVNSNPLYSIIKDAGFTPIFNKIACIGDSLTEGTFESTEGTGDIVPNLSTPSQMQRIIGNTVFNLGIGGTRASRESSSVSWYDRAISKGWFNDEYKSECYIIALGVNDTWTESGFTGNVSTDIDINNYNNNSNNSVGGYATIIQKILEIQPRAKIFCVTIPLTSGNSNKRTEANQKIKSIANLFNCYILDFEQYFVDSSDVSNWSSIYKMGGHLNPLGYKLVANSAITYIDWIIRNNPSDFKESCFIGTTRHYN